MSSGLVSIIMPSYNTALYIAESIKSVIAQTYQNWELIIIDDCSSDNTDSVVLPFLSDSRILYQKNNINLGAANSRNIALKKANGKWITFLDSDDLWHQDKLNKQIEFMEINNYHFTYTCYSEMSEDGEKIISSISGPQVVGRLKMQAFNYLGCLTVMYNSEVIGLIQVPDLKKRNDWAMWLLAVKKAPCYLLNENLSTYRLRKSGSLTHTKGGKVSLIKYHYKLFRQVENKNPISAILWTMINILAGVYKRIAWKKVHSLKKSINS